MLITDIDELIMQPLSKRGEASCYQVDGTITTYNIELDILIKEIVDLMDNASYA